MTRPKAPPLKTQGIKTRLIPFIRSHAGWDGDGRWIEPFLGSGAVLFNVAPARALVADSNRHIIRFYRALQTGRIGAEAARRHLEREGARLARDGEAHYYRLRERFNRSGDPLDFLFLSRAGFNGVMRFNGQGAFNVPFCRKPQRFSAALVTKICNQIAWAAGLLEGRDWRFETQDWRATLAAAGAEDFVYLDPPYIGRHADYYARWTAADADALAGALKTLPCRFAYSMWAANLHRDNPHLAAHFADHDIVTTAHFYHVGGSLENRGAVEEALVLGPPAMISGAAGRTGPSAARAAAQGRHDG